MRFLIIFISLFAVSACSSINVREESNPEFETLFIAKVVGKKQVTLEANESKSGRALVGFLAGGIIGAIAASDTEEGFSSPQAFSYTLNINQEGTREVLSYSLVDIGECVEAISPDNSSIEILMAIPLKNCSKILVDNQIPNTESQLPTAQTPTPQPKQLPKTVKRLYSGTGFMFGSKDYVITNWHVIRGTKNIKVKFLNGEKINAELLLKDPQNDIAFLKLERSPELPPSDLKIGDSSKVRLGDKVFTIGYPAHWVMGQNPKYTSGDVNALSGIKDDPTVFQISVQIQPGNSGGPLFNQSGEVIGITQASLDPKVAIGTFGTLPQNVNYAIKSSYLTSLLPMLPETLIASRGISVVPTEHENSLSNFIEKAKNNVVLIEAVSKQ